MKNRWTVFRKIFRLSNFTGIAFRYSLFFLFGISLIFLVAFYYSYVYSERVLTEGARNDADILTRKAIADFENTLQPIELIPSTLVRMLETDRFDTGEVMRIARDFVSNNLVVFGTCLALEPGAGTEAKSWHATYSFEKGGKIRTLMLGGHGYDYFKMDWYRLPKSLGRAVWTEPYFDSGGGDTLMCTYATPVFREVRGKRVFSGVLTMDVSLKGFEKMIDAVVPSDRGYGILVSGNGRVITAPRPALVNRNIREIAEQRKGKQSQVAVRDMLAGGSGFALMDGLEGAARKSYLSYAPVGRTGWSFGIIYPADQLIENLVNFLRRLQWILAWSVFLLFIMTILITRRMTRPIVRLVEATGMIGKGNFNVDLPARKGKDEIAELTHAFSLMQEHLRTYIQDLKETTMAKERIESELKVAHSIQMGMLPHGFSSLENWDLFALLEPAREVGGDLYDYFYPDEGHLCIAIGDVAGKGVPASLFMMVTRTLLRSKVQAGIPVDTAVNGINQELCRENPSQMFVTMFAGIVDLKTGVMEFCNAGHNYPWFVDSRGMVRQEKIRNGLPLGIFDTATYSRSTYRFAPGEVMVLTTDGVSDALNPRNEFFGEGRLADYLASGTSADSHAIAGSLMEEVRLFSEGAEQADDIAILALRYRQAGGNLDGNATTVLLELRNSIEELPGITEAVLKVAGDWDLPEKLAMEINLAIEELFTNIVFYAFEDTKEHKIRVGLQRTENNEVTLRIEDDGKPFNLLDSGPVRTDQPADERSIGGLGIHLVKELFPVCRYLRENEMNVVLLTKKINHK